VNSSDKSKGKAENNMQKLCSPALHSGSIGRQLYLTYGQW